MADPVTSILTGLFYANKLAQTALKFMDKVDRGEMTQAEADLAFVAQAKQIATEEARFDHLTGSG